MKQDLSHYRKDFKNYRFDIDNLPSHPMHLFDEWFNYVDKKFIDFENNAMVLSTISLDGFPRGRVVLLKEYSDDGFVFFTNYKSEKGMSIKENHKVSLCFYWPYAEKQITVKGYAKRTNNTLNDFYFQSRPRKSQLGAVASTQSQVLEKRSILDESVRDVTDKFKEKKINRPKFWGGYLIKPITIEFWQGRPNRLHDRVLYKLTKRKIWRTMLLYP